MRSVEVERTGSEYSNMLDYEKRYVASAAWTAKKAGKVAVRNIKELAAKVKDR